MTLPSVNTTTNIAQNVPRRKQKSIAEEPTAFRLNRGTPSPQIDPSVFDSVLTAPSNTPAETPPLPSPPIVTVIPNDVVRPPPEAPAVSYSHSYSHSHSHSDPSSWLSSTDLQSPNFNAHHFLQRVLSHRYENKAKSKTTPAKSKASRLTSIDENNPTNNSVNTFDDFDTDSALAALDTVENALCRRRDAAFRDEQAACEDLRNALNASSKRHDLLLRTAHTVSSHVITFGNAGRDAANALRNDLESLNKSSSRLVALQDARDLLALLSRTDASAELDAVRVSKLLASARVLLELGKLDGELSQLNVARAHGEIQRSERELATSIFDCMKRAVDAKNARLLASCAAAAEQLGVSEHFVEAYMEHVFHISSDHGVRTGQKKCMWNPELSSSLQSSPSSSQDVLHPFHVACRESVVMVRDDAATVLKSFSDARKPLDTLLRIIANRKVLVAADSILNSLIATIRATEQRLQELKSSNNDNSVLIADLSTASRRRSSLERVRSLAISDSKETWRDHAKRLSDERRYYLITCADIFTSLSKLKVDLFDACRNAPCVGNLNNVFLNTTDPYLGYISRYLGQYLEIQKTWMDDQLGAAFFDITRIDMHAPRLAPRERSNADVYHRYRAFYGHVSSSFLQMTKRAILSTNECITRTVSVLGSVLTDNDNSSKSSTTTPLESSCFNESSVSTKTSATNETDSLSKQFSIVKKDETTTGTDKMTKPLSSSPRTFTEMKIVVRELLDNLVMNYVANVETLLQAATHLLPVCEEDARMTQLWMSGASPLTAYIQAVDVLTKSNSIIDEFVTSISVTGLIDETNIGRELELDEDGHHRHSQYYYSHHLQHDWSVSSEKNLLRFIPIATRDMLHGELASGLSDLSAEAQIGVQAAISSLRVRLFAMLGTKTATRVYSMGLSDNNTENGENEEGNSRSSNKSNRSSSCNSQGSNNTGSNRSRDSGGLGLGWKRKIVTRKSVAYGVVGFDDMALTHVGLDTEPSEAFISASTFVEQQLQSVSAGRNSHNSSNNSHYGSNKEFVIREMGKATCEAVLHCWCQIDGSVADCGALQMIEDGKTMVRVFRNHAAATDVLESLPAIGQLFLEAPEDLWSRVESRALADVDANIIVSLLKKRVDFDESERVTKVCQSLQADFEEI